MVDLAGARGWLRSLRVDDIDVLVAAREDDPVFAGRGADEVRERLRKLVERRPGLEKDGFLEAVTVFTDYLFGEGWERVQASTAVDNVSMRRLLERAAYGFEGVLRQFGPGVDGREDYAMYAATRGDRGAARG